MSYATIRAQIKSNLESASGIGVVHDYRRHTTFWGEYYKRHVKDMQVNNWEITRTSATEGLFSFGGVTATDDTFHDFFNILIIGHMSLNDDRETEKTFQTLIDAIVTIFRADNQLNQTILLPRQLQVPIIEHRTFGGVLCHYCEMNIEGNERVSA